MKKKTKTPNTDVELFAALNASVTETPEPFPPIDSLDDSVFLPEMQRTCAPTFCAAPSSARQRVRAPPSMG
jgi:hypothetical protein